NNTQVAICREDSVVSKGKVSKLSVYEGLKQVEVDEATSGEIVNEVFDLFVDLNATDEQCEFPIIYGIAKQGIAKLEMDDDSE
ncbi:hypothetical protein GSQ49_21825, partial [Clostridioides difficile]|nr:hypothetical protein [Clostridioides difficile]